MRATAPPIIDRGSQPAQNRSRSVRRHVRRAIQLVGSVPEEGTDFVTANSHALRPVGPTQFRRAMGRFATGVSIVTTTAPGGPLLAMTASAVSSVSLTPPLVLVCIGKRANLADAIREAEGFAFSFLHESQAALSNYFAGFWPEDMPDPSYEFVSWAGQVRIAGAIAAMACRRTSVYEEGDHWIVVGEVTDTYVEDGAPAPLLYVGGGYGRYQPFEEPR